MSDKYELPNLNYVLDRIGGDTLFSVFDLSASFHQVPYSEKSKPITAFTYNGKRFNFARMIMGHATSSSKFTRMLTKLLANIPIEQLVFFIDDLMISSQDVKSHLYRLEILLERIASANLKLTPKKSELLKTEVRFVGVTVSSEGIRINEDRVKALKSLPHPKSVKEVQKVLGTFNFVRKWIPNYSAITRPMHNLTKKSNRFYWSDECQKSFDSLKEAIASSTTLALPDVEDPLKSYEVTIDASNMGYAGTLSQIIRGERRIVAYFSKAVPPYKRDRGQTRLEFEAMYEALQHWKIYLRGTKFRVITDCKSLLSVHDTLFAKINPTLIRRCQELANFDFEIQHIEGEKNSICDFLSRLSKMLVKNVACQK